MSSPKTGRRLLLPSLSDWLFAALIAWLFIAGSGWSTLLADGDTGWHIRTGEYILDNHRLPEADLFSFSRAGERHKRRPHAAVRHVGRRQIKPLGRLHLQVQRQGQEDWPGGRRERHLDRPPHGTQHGAKEGDHVARRVEGEPTALTGHRRLCTDLPPSRTGSSARACSQDSRPLR